MPFGDVPFGDLSEDAEIAPLTDAEFERLQAELKAANTATERLPDGTPMTYRAAASFVDDHSMLMYLEKIRNLLRVDRAEAPR